MSRKDAAIIAEEIQVKISISKEAFQRWLFKEGFSKMAVQRWLFEDGFSKKAAAIRIVINFTCLTYETSLMPAGPETNR
jgi:hypothetical protein